MAVKKLSAIATGTYNPSTDSLVGVRDPSTAPVDLLLAGVGAPGGTSGQIQYNNSGAFGASPNLTFDGTAFNAGDILTVTGTGSPSPNGTYVLGDGPYNAMPYYTNGTYYIWWSNPTPVTNAWVISTGLGNTSSGYWQGSPILYSPSYSAHTYTGTVGVAPANNNQIASFQGELLANNIQGQNYGLGFWDVVTVGSGGTPNVAGNYYPFNYTLNNGTPRISYTNGVYDMVFTPSSYYIYPRNGSTSPNSFLNNSTQPNGTYTRNSGSWSGTFTAVRSYSGGVVSMHAPLIVGDIYGVNVFQSTYYLYDNGNFFVELGGDIFYYNGNILTNGSDVFSAGGSQVFDTYGVLYNAGNGNQINDTSGSWYYPSGNLWVDNNVTTNSFYDTQNGSIQADTSGGFYLSQTSEGDNGLFYDSSQSTGTVGQVMGSQGPSSGALWVNPTTTPTPFVGGPVNLTAQSAAISATTMLSNPTLAMYRISYVATITRAASVSSVLGGTNGFQIKYTDGNDSVVKTSAAGPTVSTNSTGNTLSGVLFAYVKTNTNLQYSFDYTSAGTTAMQFNLHVYIERMN